MIPISQGQMPPWPETKPQGDPLAPARGIVFSVLFSLPAWLIVAFLIWLLVV